MDTTGVEQDAFSRGRLAGIYVRRYSDIPSFV
jgi:hypothetical protein